MNLSSLLEKAEKARASLVQRLAAEETDCWRLFHGVVEGRSGLTVDRYGTLVLAQTFRDPLGPEELSCLQQRYGERLVYNHRGGSKKERFSYHSPSPQAELSVCRELGLKYAIRARHEGLDPHLFLDFRVGRRWALANSRERSVLNLFSYSCGLGQVALAGGAREVWNVDFSDSALAVGRENLTLNGLTSEGVTFLRQDAFPVLWQLSGMGVKGRRARRPFKKLEPRSFDLVLLDPPARAKGPFHNVDLINDYQSLFKPALLCCAPGGTVLAANNVGSVEPEAFEATLRRCAEKAGLPLAELTWLTPDEDFPSFDGRHPLKLVLCRLADN